MIIYNWNNFLDLFGILMSEFYNIIMPFINEIK